MGPRAQHQQITPVTDETLADQDIVYLKYQQALIFVFGDLGVFNALTVLSLATVIEKARKDSKKEGVAFIPNVNGRPIPIRAYSTILDRAHSTYETACSIYQAAEAEMQEKYRTQCLARDVEEVDVGELEISDD